jgi:glycosyltransferase involved in cell wall biosynthesis
MKKLLMVANVDWFFISHRLCIAQEALKQGWQVTVAAENTGRSEEIESMGIKYINFPFSRSGTNPIQELNTLNNFYKLYKDIQPDVVHHITLKPVIYGSFIAKILGVKGVLNAISGLGYNFTEGRSGIISNVMIQMMRFSFSRNNVSIIFQNQEDFQHLKNLKVIDSKNMVVFIKGSGVDLEVFKPVFFEKKSKVTLLLPTRMLWDKGVKEVKEASAILKTAYQDKIRFVLSGLADEENKAGVPSSYLNDWQDGSYVKWVGYQKDMVAIYQDADIVLLPSYREGMPKTLIEACAMGKPIITTDAIGCKECVDEGVNGLKVAVKSSEGLAAAIVKLVENDSLREEMGKQSRLKAIKEFDQKGVVAKHLDLYALLLNVK